MAIHEQNHGAVVVLRPQGPLVEAGAEELRERLTDSVEKSLGRVVLDVSEIPYVDSRGLEVLVEITEELSRAGQALKLCGANETVREVLEITDLASLFEHFEDAQNAVRSFL